MFGDLSVLKTKIYDFKLVYFLGGHPVYVFRHGIDKVDNDNLWLCFAHVPVYAPIQFPHLRAMILH